jgi:NAD(P)-dependent dehydrogenase (short-subunit alcohol dehydrogenase family)
VVVNYSSSKEGAERVVAEIARNGGSAIAVQGDVSKPPDIEHLFSEAKRSFDRVDILVNNAGVYESVPLEAVTEEHCQLCREVDAGAELRRVRGVEGRGRGDHRRACERARPAEDSRECDQPRMIAA